MCRKSIIIRNSRLAYEKTSTKSNKFFLKIAFSTNFYSDESKESSSDCDKRFSDVGVVDLYD